MTTRTLLFAIALFLFNPLSYAEVEELSNTEMTEAYIKDGSIIFKQRNVAATPKKTIKVTIKAGQPVTTEAEEVSITDQSNASQYTLINQELNRDQGNRQLNKIDFNVSSLGLQIPEFTSAAQQAQMQYAQDLVRSGMGLTSGAEVTPEIMGQYLATFSGQSYGDPLGAQQLVTPNGVQFSMPNLGGQLDSGLFPSGNNSMNAEVTNQLLLFNLFFPQEQP
jgi:hypothetical protein